MHNGLMKKIVAMTLALTMALGLMGGAVAEEQPNPAFAAKTLLPTGSAVSIYSSITAANIFFFRSLISISEPLWFRSFGGFSTHRFTPLALLTSEC